MLVVEAPMAPIDLAALRVGERLEGRLLVVEAAVMATRSGSPYLRATLRDRAGCTVRAVYFDFGGATPGPAELVEVRAVLGMHHDRPQLRLDRLTILGDAEPGEWAVEVDVPLAERRVRLRHAVDAIEEPYLRLLVDAVLSGALLERFLVAPAAKRYHSAKVGGLALHTLAVHDEALHLAGAHCRLRLDPDLLRAGALLHDVGKADELEVSARTGLLPGYTGAHPQGHVALGIRRVERAAAELSMLDDTRVDHLVHLLVSHHGTREHGAPEPPMTPEAVVLHEADHAASRLEGLCDLVEATPAGALWTERSGMFDEQLYLGWR